MATILLVDDDPDLRRTVRDVFRRRRASHELLLARDGSRALTLLEGHSVDLLVVDLQMPLMDGFELASFALRLQPRLALFLLSEVSLGLDRDELEQAGVSEVLIKPVSAETLVDRIEDLFARRVRGQLEGIGLSALLQLLHHEGSTVRVAVASEGRHGSVELDRGQLKGASCSDLRGREAVLELLSWADPRLEVIGSAGSGPRQVEESLQGLLMEAARRQDEARRGRAAERHAAPEEPQQAERLGEQVQGRVLSRLELFLEVRGVRAAAVLDPGSGTPLLAAGRRPPRSAERDARILGQLLRQRWPSSEPRPGFDTALELRTAYAVERYRIVGSRPLVLWLELAPISTDERRLEALVDELQRLLAEDGADEPSGPGEDDPIAAAVARQA